jgi:hypothetical protein
MTWPHYSRPSPSDVAGHVRQPFGGTFAWLGMIAKFSRKRAAKTLLGANSGAGLVMPKYVETSNQTMIGISARCALRTAGKYEIALKVTIAAPQINSFT